MATVKPFQAFRYTEKAGDPATLLTQPYDKISPEMHERYLAASPYNLVRVLLGEPQDSDNDDENVYTRAAACLNDWIRDGILAQDPEPGFYVYSQEFDVPDSNERITRQGFIGLTKVEDYDAKVVFRHEQTLTGPKRDRLELLRHTRAHFGQIFMLYPDPEYTVDRVLRKASSGNPVFEMADEYSVYHRLWPVTDPEEVEAIQAGMEDKRLLIADGHHRYETALAYARENPDDPAAQYVMMTMVNMHSTGLKILPTHRVLRNVPEFDAEALVAEARKLGSLEELKLEFSSPVRHQVRFGIIVPDGVYLLERPRRNGELDVPVLHNELIEGRLGITQDQVREQSFISYVRGVENAAAEVFERGAQAAFIVEATPIEDMARIAFGGGVMPQKSTDFYPKLLSGIAIYKL